MDRATVRKYLAQADSKSPTPQTGSSTGCGPASLCEPWREQIEQALAQGLSIQRIYQDLVVERQLFCGTPLCVASGEFPGTAVPADGVCARSGVAGGFRVGSVGD